MAITSDILTTVSPPNTSAPNHGSGMATPKIPIVDKSGSDGAKGTSAVTVPSSDRILINELEGANEEIREVARQIREVDHTMDAISQNLEKMTASLETIVQQYPPYLLKDKERVTALRQFLGLRQMIDKLTLPAPDDTPVKILGDKQRYPQAGDWELPSGKGHARVTLKHQPVHSDAGGLDLPDLSIDSSDAAVKKAFGQMAKSHAILRQRRYAFAEDANRVMASFF